MKKEGYYTSGFSTITGNYVVYCEGRLSEVTWVRHMDEKQAKESIATIKKELALLKVKRGLNTLKNLSGYNRTRVEKKSVEFDKQEKELEKWLEDCYRRIKHIRGLESGKVVDMRTVRDSKTSYWDRY